MLNDSWGGRNPTKCCITDWRRSRLAIGNRTKNGPKSEMRKFIPTGLYHGCTNSRQINIFKVEHIFCSSWAWNLILVSFLAPYNFDFVAKFCKPCARLVYLYIFYMTQQPPVGQGLLIIEVSRSHSTTHHSRYDFSGRVISSLNRPTWQHTTLRKDIRVPGWIRTHNLSKRVAVDVCLRPRSRRDRRTICTYVNMLTGIE
jgi:hypothetical protein